jgi:hypothetical protein
MAEYIKEYNAYINRKAYRVLDSNDGAKISADEMQLKLNQLQERGYEMTAVVADSLVVFRSMPPLPPSNTDVINEFTTRKEKIQNRAKDVKADAGNEDDFDTIGSA